MPRRGRQPQDAPGSANLWRNPRSRAEWDRARACGSISCVYAYGCGGLSTSALEECILEVTGKPGRVYEKAVNCDHRELRLATPQCVDKMRLRHPFGVLTGDGSIRYIRIVRWNSTPVPGAFTPAGGDPPPVKEGHCNADCQTEITDEAMFHLLRSIDELVSIHADALEKSRAISSAWGERYRQTPASSIYGSSESGSGAETSGDSMAPPGLRCRRLCPHR